MLTRNEIASAFAKWSAAWNAHDLDGVMDLFHEDIYFENWTGGSVKGKANLQQAWLPWFTNHGGFVFTDEETFIDEVEQKVLYRWQLDSPSFEKGFEDRHETRRGVDVIHFQDGKIIQKLTYSKTTLEIGGERMRLMPGQR
ncbi:MAG: hypothetical protein ETSY1_32065 [Candidatus Entotheonella factor]|uniref:SnoaL-like domain-containing protein n=1 Tax=Entotheonella factor TaxID=1429438 RepID=W4LAX9_ENTF1|nr:nuclear transport factor 2 family protein [Candidatus Entotheonella palauensis]ETW95089.1 MAG: hypothetical protein ETSY1_32065 [Candidatus Entotheonella factor]